jgi:hypothetical protein
MHHPEHLPEKVTGAQADRRELLRMLKRLAPGDVLTVTRIDRLARSTFGLFGIVKRIVDTKAQFRSLAGPCADTGTGTRRLILVVLGGLADVERDVIRTRTAEGRSRAKAQGKRDGSPEQRKEATRRHTRDVTLQELAQLQRRDIHHPPCQMRRVSPLGLDAVPLAIKLSSPAASKSNGRAHMLRQVKLTPRPCFIFPLTASIWR